MGPSMPTLRTLGRAALASLLLSMPATATARPEAAASDPTRPIRFERLAADQGLSQSTVTSIFQDSRGYLWVGTEDGLNRYDAVGFRVYSHDPADPASIPASFVWAMDEDAAGNLWIATDGGGLVTWDRASDRFVRHAGLSSPHLRALRVGPDGAIWVGTRESGLDRYEPASGQVTRFVHDAAKADSLGDNRIFALAFDRGGDLWVGTDAGLSRLDRAAGTFSRVVHEPGNPASLSQGRVRALLVDETGLVWVGTHGGGLNLLDPATGHSRHFRHDPANPVSLSHDQVRAIFRDDAGRLWVGTSRGLDLYDAEQQAFSHYRSDASNPTSLADDTVMAIAQDRTGLLWVGTRLGGLHKWHPHSWQFGHVAPAPQHPQGLASGLVTSFAEDAAGRLWVGTFGAGLQVLNRAAHLATRYTHRVDDDASLPSDRVTALVHGRAGALWVGTLDGGLGRFDAASGTFTRYRHDPADQTSLAANGVMTLLEDSSGRLWVGTFGGGLHRLDAATSRFARFRHDPANPASLSGDRVTSLAEAADGSLWVGTDGNGLNRFDPRSGEARRFAHVAGDPDSLPSNVVYALLVDAAGGVWAGTRAGLAHLAPGATEFETFTTRQGLPNDTVYGIRADRHGRLWLSTNNGLAAFDTQARTWRTFGVEHGLQGREFNFGASYQSASGELFFGGTNGFNAFHPDRLRVNTVPPGVVLTHVAKGYRALETPADQVSHVRLGYRDHVVRFEFAALDFTSPRHNRFAYRLEGFDERWIEFQGHQPVTYTNLRPGRYTFHVRAANSDGTWNDEGLRVGLDVDAPPWATPWAYGGYSFLFLGGLVGLVRTQQRKMEREAQYARDLELRVYERTRELERVNRELARASITDSLTGLANRRFLIEHVEKEIQLLQSRYRSIDAGTMTHGALDIGFMMIDLDCFKAINDSAGHAAGDEVLRQLRDILADCCSSSDIVIRWGGDEFLVVVRDTNTERVSAMAERIRARLAGHAFDVGNSRTVHTTCSIGFACYPFHSEFLDELTWEQVVGVADRALYVAKASGRNGWVGFSAGTGTPIQGIFAEITTSPEVLIRSGQLRLWSSHGERALAWH